MSNYQTEKSRLALARTLAEEGIVLLKNDKGILPLKNDTKIALLGRTQNDAVIGGGGSGASFSAHTLQAATEFNKAGLKLEPMLETFYREIYKAEQAALGDAPTMADFDLEGLVNSGMIYEIFGKYHRPAEEPMPGEKLWKQAAAWTDTAVYILGRSAGGEECDRRVKDDYYLLDSEMELIKKAAAYFPKVIVVLNVNGAVDTGWIQNYPQVCSVLFAGSFGEQGMGALTDLLVGKAVPSGKLAQTLALCYEDYPSARHMTFHKENEEDILTYESYGLSAKKNGSVGFAKSPVTVYQEGIYVGYRYFDSFEKPVMYPFGHGLSYAVFSWDFEKAEIADGELRISVRIKNESQEYSGKEVLQLYAHAPSGRLEQPYQQLKAIEKTKLLCPQEEQRLVLKVSLEDLASFDEVKRVYIMEAGNYDILLGTSSASTRCVAELCTEKEILVRKTWGNMGLTAVNHGKIGFCRCEKIRNTEKEKEVVRLFIEKEDVSCQYCKEKNYDFSRPAQTAKLQEVYQGKVSMEAFLNQMTIEELAVLCCGYGPGLPFGGCGKDVPSTIFYENGKAVGYNSHENAAPGYASPALEKYGICSVSYKDGPASVGKTAWPTGMLLGNTFNKQLLYEFGNACGREAEEQKIDSWLAPGMNLIRNPIGGRCFEYFSEDPYLAGMCGTQIVLGAMENNAVTACPKHFALNEQETYRRGSEKYNYDAVDTIAEERTVREMYLKPFEMIVREAEPQVIMTSFNKINGIFAAGNKNLCTDILRKEWGYRGVVITDWGDMDMVADGADAVAAGNDIIMPGGPPVIRQILKGYQEGRVSAEELKTAAARLLEFVMNTGSFLKKKEEN